MNSYTILIGQNWNRHCRVYLCGRERAANFKRANSRINEDSALISEKS